MKKTGITHLVIGCLYGAILVGCSEEQNANLPNSRSHNTPALSQASSTDNLNVDLLTAQKNLSAAQVHLSKVKLALLAAESREYEHTFAGGELSHIYPYDAADCANALAEVYSAEERLMSAELDVAFAVTMTKYQGMYAAVVTKAAAVSPSVSTSTLILLTDQY